MIGYECYACGKKVKPRAYVLSVALEDDEGALVGVGPDCQRKVRLAGVTGYQPPRGGPRLFDSAKSRQHYLSLKKPT